MQKIQTLLLERKTSEKICPKHNCHFVGFSGHAFVCPICQQEAMRQEEKAMVDKHKRDAVTGFLKRNSLVDDEETYDVSFDSYKAETGTPEYLAKQQARRIAGAYYKDRDIKFNTLFYGFPGNGKTHLAMSILKAVNDNANPAQKCLFINMETLFTKIKGSFNNLAKLWTEEYAIKVITDADLVVLDDLGSESAMRDQSEATEFIQRLLKNILNKQKRIIITTNLTNEQLNRVYNPKIVSRLLRGSKGHTVNFNNIKDKRAGL